MTSGDIYFGDCLEDMKLLPDQSVDMILCDLPYGTTQNKWDSIIPLNKLWAEYRRIAKPSAAIVLTAAQPFTSILVASNIEDFRYEWIWRKDNATNFLNAKKQPLRIHESILVFYKEQSLYIPQKWQGKPYKTKGNGPTSNYGHQISTATINETGERYPLSIVDFTRDKDKVHPTQKPIALFEYLIKTYTNEGDIVLDNCAGSGTTGLACINTNRRYILMEKEQKYIDIINERLGLKCAE